MLKQTIINAVSAAMTALGDLAVPATLLVASAVSYIPGVPVTPESVSYSVRVVLTSFTLKEIDGDRIQSSDVKAILMADQSVPAPSVGDQLLVNQSTYRILHCDRAMAGDAVVLTQLHLRLA